MSNNRASISFTTQNNSATTSHTGQGRSSTASASSRRASSRASIRPKVDLLPILQNKTKSPITLKQFRDFMTNVERGAESLNFWEAVEELKQLENQRKEKDLEEGRDEAGEKEINNLVDIIVKTYLKPGAEQELNISSASRKEVLAALSTTPLPECPSSMLLNIQKHCFELMSLNSLPRFLTESMKNIDTKEQKIRIWFVSIPTGLLLIALTVIAWTVPSFKRRHRWTVVIPAFACFLGLWQSYMALCVCHAALGTAKFGGKVTKVDDVCVRASHRHQLFNVLVLTTLSAVGWTLMVYFVPLNT